MTRAQDRGIAQPLPELVRDVTVSLVRFQDLAAGHLESMGDRLMLSRDVVLRSKERLAMFKLRDDRTWK